MLCLQKYLYGLLSAGFLIFPLVSFSADSLPPHVPGQAATVVVPPQRNLAHFAPSQRIASRIISEDTLWNGAILVEGMVTIAAQATLTIAPGTVVRFGSDSGIFVLGRIAAKGTAEQPVILTAKFSEPLPSDWYGIVLTGTAKKNIFEQVKIQGAAVALYARSSSLEMKQLSVQNCSVAVKLADSIAYLKNIEVSDCFTGLTAVKSEIDLEAVVIERCAAAFSVTSSALAATGLKILYSSLSAFVAEKSQLKIESSVFSDNHTGIMVIGSEGSLETSKFTANADTAVTFSGSLLKFSSNLVSGNKIGVQLVDNLPSIWGNSIYANSSYNLLYLGEDMLYAGANWFGSESPEKLNRSLFSKRPNAIQIQPLLGANPFIDQRKDP